MKRSEMIKRLTIPLSLDVIGYTNEELEKVADDLLNICEEAGMLPPVRYEKEYGISTNPYYKWDPEEVNSNGYDTSKFIRLSGGKE